MQTDSSPQSSETFDQRKKDHIEISLQNESQTTLDQFAVLKFKHNPLPEINFAEVSLSTSVFGHPLKSPLFVSSMTLGHQGAEGLNNIIAGASQKRGWMMGVGSQRKQLFDPSAYLECEKLRSKHPDLVLFGNIGLSQIVEAPIEKLQSLASSLGAQFMVVHTNPLQEAIQKEGTPQFRGSLKALEKLCTHLNLPVVLKETGCGFSQESFERLKNVGLSAIDVSGLGGTHWGLVEGLRQNSGELGFEAAQTFCQWGVSTVDSIKNGVDSKINTPLWASGGVRSGLDAAKLMALGAQKVGFAQPILKSAVIGRGDLDKKMLQLDHELKVALFCLGITEVDKLQGRRDLLQ